MRLLDGSYGPGKAWGQLMLLVPAAAFCVVGLLVALRVPANPAGWQMLVIGGIWSLGRHAAERRSDACR